MHVRRVLYGTGGYGRESCRKGACEKSIVWECKGMGGRVVGRVHVRRALYGTGGYGRESCGRECVVRGGVGEEGVGGRVCGRGACGRETCRKEGVRGSECTTGLKGAL